MKTLIQKTLALAAAFIGLQLFTATTAQASTTKTWTKFCENQTYVASASAGITQYDQNQAAFIFKVNVAASSVNADTQILRYGASNSNYVYVKTTAGGKYRIEIWRNGQSTNLTQDSTVDVTEGYHVFVLKVRRGDGTMSQLLSTILYMDGSEIAKIVYGQDGRASDLKFSGSPMSTMEIGQSGKENNISMYRISAVESGTNLAKSYADDTTNMQTYVADAKEIYPPLVAFFYGSTVVDGATYTAPDGIVYTLAANGNTAVAGGGIQISANKGVSVTPASGNIGNQATTVIIKYTNFDTSSLASTDAKVLIVNHTANTSYKDVLGMAATDGGNIWGLWQNTTWSNNKTTTGVYGSSSSDVKQFALGWTQTATAVASVGTYFYMDGQNKAGWSGLHGNLDVDGVWIGGPNEGTGVTPATGMKILGIAVFGGRLSDADMAAYNFPAVTYTATVSGNTKFSEITTWSPARPASGFDRNSKIVINNTAAAKLTIDEDVTALSFAIQNTSGNGLTLGLDGHCITAAWDQTAAAGGVTVDATGVSGAILARYAVAGAPYSYWYIRGTGTLPNNPSTMPTMPDGYTATAEKYTGTGLRLVVTATSAQFGSVNINFAGGRNSASFNDEAKVGTYETMQGGYSVIGTSWNDLEAKNYTGTATKYIITDGTVKTDGNISVKVTQCNNPYTTGQGDAYKHTITYGYIDDGGNPIVEISNIPFAKYRVILYRATDGTGTFSAAQIGTTSSNTKIYYGPTKSSTTAAVTFFGDSEVGWGMGQQAGYTEGMNYIVSDVLEGTPGSATAYIYSHKYDGRAGVAAIQIVEVGVVAQIGTVGYPSLAAAEAAVQSGETIQLLFDVNESLSTAKTFTLDLNGKTLMGTLTIDEAGAVTLTTLPAANTLKISGSGRLVYNNATLPTVNSIWNSDWTGTFAYGGFNGSTTNWDLTSYYNGANSKFEFNGTLTGGYFAKKNWTLGDLIVNGSITVTDGFSIIDGGAETVYAYKALKGTGSITTNKSGVRSVLRFDTMDTFTGRISLTGFRVIVGTSEVTISSTTPANSTITLLDKASLTANTLTASSGIAVKTAVGGTTTLASATTFADNAELDARASLLTANGTLTFGANTKVRVAAAPTAENPLVKVMNKSNAGQSVFGTTVALYVGEATEPTSGNFKLAYNNDGLYVAFVQNFAAEITESTSWSQIPWGGTSSSPFDTYTLTVTGEGIVLTFDQIVNSPASLTINGSVKVAMADALYEDGCWEKAFAAFGTLTAANVAFADLKTDFYGLYSQTATSFRLRAQNKEVISINIAGGSGGGSGGDSPTENLVTGSDFYGIAPTVGSSWNNINRQWQSGGNQTITINSPNAYDGQTTIQRPTMSLSATGKNTWQCGDIANAFLRGYLDDGNGVTVMVHGIPYTKYDVIVYATSDDAGIRLAPVTINGTKYTFADGETKPGATVWGQGKYATPEIGKNALRINNCEGGTLTINAVRASNPDGRATLCAVQVINKGEVVVSSKYVADVTAANVTWTNGEDEGLTKRSIGEWANSQLSTLTLTNTVASTLTFNPAQVLTGLTFKVVSAANTKMTIPYASLAKLSFAQLDFSEAVGKVEIDMDGVTEGAEGKTILAGTLTGPANVTFASTGTWGAYADATGIHMAKTAQLSRNNPVTGTATIFERSFFGSTDASWNTLANWRKPEDGLMVTATALPGISGGDYPKILIDGNDSAQDTVSVDTLEGYNIQYAFLNGAKVTASTLTKMQSDGTQFIWVDGTSSFTVNALGDNQNWGTLNLYVAAENGITFPVFGKGATLNYYLKGSGSVKFTGAVTAGTHAIKQMDLTVGMTEKTCHHVEKTKLVTLAANSTVTFAKADDIVIKIDNTSVTPTYQADIPTVQNDVGTYTIKTEADGVYVYVVQYADQWDIVDPLTVTLTDNTAWSSIVWKDTYNHEFTNPSGTHQYKLTAGDYTATFDTAPASGSTVEIVTGTLTLNNAEAIAADTPITIDNGATLLVTASGLKASKVTNNGGTLKFEGGDSSNPIAVTGNANLKATLAADTYVKNTVDGNHIHNITGVGATSFYALGKASGGAGFTDGTTFANLTLVSDLAAGERVWIERSTYDNVGLVANTDFYLSGLSPTVVSLSGAGSVTRAGSTETLTIACTAASDYSGASTVPFTIGTCTAVQTLSGSYTGALTVNADGQVKLAGSAVPSSITSAGTVTFDYGAGTTKTAVIANNTGTIKIDSGTVVLKGYRGTVTLAEGAKVGYVVNINDCGSFTPPTGVSVSQIELYDGNDTKLDTTVEGGKVKYDWAGTITGHACWWDYEFEGNGNNDGTEGTALSWDDPRPFQGNEYTENGELRIPSSPWRGGITWPETATFVLYGTMVGTDKTYQLGFGSTYQGTKPYYTIFLATDTVSKDTVNLCITTAKNAPTVLCQMTVPNAQSTKHLYAFTLKVVDSKTVIDIYLDGELLQSYPFDALVTLGSGFQIGSGHGGVCEGYNKSSATDPAVMDFLRVYTTELSTEALAKYAVEYPYVSPNGSYQRTVTGKDNLWAATEAWAKEGTTEKADAPVANATVKIEASGTATINANLAADTTYEAVRITGDDLTIARADGYTGKVKSSGRVTAGANVTFCYDAFSMENTALTIKAGKKVTFDLRTLDLNNVFASTTLDLTGYITQEEGASITYIPPTELYGRELSADVDPTTKHYILTVTVTPHPFVFTIAQGQETGAWTWNGQPVTAEQVAAQTSGEIQKAGDGTATLTPQAGFSYTVNENGGTLKFGSEMIRGMNVRVNSGATFDLNGLKAKEMNLTLAGGTITNSGSAPSEGDQIKTITLTANSEINVPNAYQVYAESYNTATTIALGEFTLTKTGSAQLKLVNTDITGTGTLLVNEGTVFNGETSRFAEGVTLSIGASGTWEQRDGDRKTNVSKVSGTEGGTLNVAGKISGFELSGTLNLTGNGSYGTITNAANAVANIGTRLNYFTFSGEGSVKTKLATDPQPDDVVTIFKVADSATTGIVELKKSDDTVIDASYYTVANGVVTFKKEAKKGTIFYFTLKQAIESQSGAATIELLADVTDGQSITVSKAITLEGDTNILAGVNFTFDGGTLTFNSGCIGIAWAEGMSPASSICRFNDASQESWTGHGPTDYVIATLSTPVRADTTYRYEFVKSGFVPTEGETLVPVAKADGTDAGAIKLNSDWVAEATGTSDPAAQAVALNTPGANNLMKWENAVLGLDGTKEESRPVVQPVQTADANNVTLKMGGVNVAAGSGAAVGFKVWTGNAPGAKTEGTEPVAYSTDASIAVPLPKTGVKYYTIEAIIATSK